MKQKNPAKQWIIAVLSITLGIFIAFAVLMYVIDPALRFHKESSLFSYWSYNQLYSGPGVATQYEYDTVVTGSCMVQQIDISQINSLFDANAIKLTYNGATAKNIKTILDICFENNSEIKQVIVPLDTFTCTGDSDSYSYDLPDYMYERTLFNDIKYLLNINLFYHMVLPNALNTLKGKTHLAMEAEPESDHTYGAELILNNYEQYETKEYAQEPADLYYQNTAENLEKNIIPLIENNPETQFTFFIPMYSILYEQKHYVLGTFLPEMESLRMVLSSLLQYENVEVYSFLWDEEFILNLDNYRDILHFGPEAEAIMISKIKNGENLLTLDNYNQQIDDFITYVKDFDYDAFWTEWREKVQ